MAEIWKPRGKIVLDGYQPTTTAGIDPTRPPRGGSALFTKFFPRPAQQPQPAPAGEFQIKPRH